jgi:hypothetical protein
MRLSRSVDGGGGKGFSGRLVELLAVKVKLEDLAERVEGGDVRPDLADRFGFGVESAARGGRGKRGGRGIVDVEVVEIEGTLLRGLLFRWERL